MHPESRLVSNDTSQVIFYCKIRDGSQSFWVVNGHVGLYPDIVQTLKSQGYFISNEANHSITTLKLTVNVTEDKNGTIIYCSVQHSVNSNTAQLLIISGTVSYLHVQCMLG